MYFLAGKWAYNWAGGGGAFNGAGAMTSLGPFQTSCYSGATNENIVQNHLNIELLNVF